MKMLGQSRFDFGPVDDERQRPCSPRLSQCQLADAAARCSRFQPGHSARRQRVLITAKATALEKASGSDADCSCNSTTKSHTRRKPQHQQPKNSAITKGRRMTSRSTPKHQPTAANSRIAAGRSARSKRKAPRIAGRRFHEQGLPTTITIMPQQIGAMAKPAISCPRTGPSRTRTTKLNTRLLSGQNQPLVLKHLQQSLNRCFEVVRVNLES